MHFIIVLNLTFGLLCRSKKRWLQLSVLILSCTFSVRSNNYIGPNDVDVYEGQNAFFEYISLVRASSLTWYRLQHNVTLPVPSDGRHVTFVNRMVTASNLTIVNVTRVDNQTKYNCARNGIYSELATLTVIIPTPLDTDYPKCTITGTVDDIHVGATVEILCTAIGGVPRPSLQWFKNNIKLEEADDFTSHVSSDTYLDILSISLSNEDNGVEFKCKADGISVVGNQSCSLVPLSIQPNVSIMVTKMSYDAGDSLNITCFGEGIPRISEYNWFFNNNHLTSSQSMFNIIENGTILEILELQTEHIGAEVRCKVSIPSGLSANKSITLSFTSHDAATGDLIIYIVSGSVLGLLILLGLLVVCIKTKIKRNHEKKSKVTTSYYVNHDVSLNQVESKEINKDWCKGEQPEHPVLMLESESVENALYFDVSDNKQNQALHPKETYSLENIPRKRPDQIPLSTGSTDDLYAEPKFKHLNRNNTDTQSIDGIDNFGNLDAEPIKKKQNTDTHLVDGIADFGGLYAKPIKGKQNPDTKAVDGKTDFGELYAKPIKHRQSFHQSEGLKDPARPEIESNTLSNNLELDFTYSSIA